jgi:hypothetical protein
MTRQLAKDDISGIAGFTEMFAVLTIVTRIMLGVTVRVV